jgi:hypothetical protein
MQQPHAGERSNVAASSATSAGIQAGLQPRVASCRCLSPQAQLRRLHGDNTSHSNCYIRCLSLVSPSLVPSG